MMTTPSRSVSLVSSVGTPLMRISLVWKLKVCLPGELPATWLHVPSSHGTWQGRKDEAETGRKF